MFLKETDVIYVTYPALFQTMGEVTDLESPLNLKIANLSVFVKAVPTSNQSFQKCKITNDLWKLELSN